jgi:hypothetical protein
MKLQSEFYLHILSGNAYEATSLMARIALNVGYDAKAYPVDLSEIKQVGLLPRDPSTTGFNELLVADFLRAGLVHGIKPWRPDQVNSLKANVDSSKPIEKDE